jgi:hypothetical protein
MTPAMLAAERLTVGYGTMDIWAATASRGRAASR